MKEVVYSRARQQLKEVMDNVVESDEPVKIVRRDHDGSVIVISERAYSSLTSNYFTEGESDD